MSIIFENEQLFNILIGLTMTISPEHQELYQWAFKDENKSCEFRFKVPPHINYKSIEVSIEKGKYIVVFIQKCIPFLSGVLPSEVRKHEITLDRDELILTLTKAQNIPWKNPIIGPHPTSKLLDSQSAFILFISNPNAPEASNLLDQTIIQGFVPALIYSARVLTGSEHPDARMQILNTAAVKYKNDDATLLLALEYIQSAETVQHGFVILCELSKKGHYEATVYIALVLSPLSDFPFPNKNAESACAILEDCLKIKVEAIALYELAKLLYAGIGTQKNVERAQTLYQQAKSLLPEIGPICQESSGGQSKFVLGTIGIIVMSGVFVLSLFKLKKK